MKSLYGLKQVKKLWNKTITKFFQKIDLTSTNTDVYIFIIKKKDELIIISIYIDNFTFELNNINVLEWLKDKLIKKFNIKNLGKAKTIIG